MAVKNKSNITVTVKNLKESKYYGLFNKFVYFYIHKGEA